MDPHNGNPTSISTQTNILQEESRPQLPKWLAQRPELEPEPLSLESIEKKPVPFLYFLSLLKALSRIKPERRSAEASYKRKRHDGPTAARLAQQRGDDPSRYDRSQACVNTIKCWIAKLPAGTGPGPQACEPGSAAAIFKLLFPEEDYMRRYGMKEQLLSFQLVKFFGLEGEAKQRLLSWDGKEKRWGVGGGKGKQPATVISAERTGSLGVELQRVLQDTMMSRDRLPEGSQFEGLTVCQVDKLLDELAMHSKWTDWSVANRDAEDEEVEDQSSMYGGRWGNKAPQSNVRKRELILRDLFRDVDAQEAGFLVQIILKDLRPVIYPLSEDAQSDFEVALCAYNTRSVKQLTPLEVMTLWHPWMPRCFAVRGNLAEAATAVEDAPRGQLWKIRDFAREESMKRTLKEGGNEVPKDLKLYTTWEGRIPRIEFNDERVKLQVGKRVEIPKCIKGTSTKMAAHVFGDAGVISAETKYDGERMQIHLELPLDGQQGPVNLRIFSKSGRDSTWDRVETHPIILAALGLDPALAEKVKGRDRHLNADQHDSRSTEELLLQRLQQVKNEGATPIMQSPKRSAVVECEMVAWDETRGHVAEFYKIAQLKSFSGFNGFDPNAPYHTSRGQPTDLVARRLATWQEKMDKQRDMLLDQIKEDIFLGQNVDDIEAEMTKRIQEQGLRDDSQGTFVSELTTLGSFHFALIFFDVLHLDGQTLLHQPYRHRRQVLESLIRPIPGFSRVVDTTYVDLGPGPCSTDTGKFENGLRQLQSAFSLCHANRGEGLVLKAVDAPYLGGSLAHGIRNGYVEPRVVNGVLSEELVSPSSWVKLKADYIPGLGDALDLCIIGASWNAKRARELRVPTGALIQFHLGALRRRDHSSKHAVHTWFTSQYGLNRRDLLTVNNWVQQGDVETLSYNEWQNQKDRLSYSLRLEEKDVKPDVIFATPILAEVIGGGFCKNHGVQRYHLRWPRITKVHHPRSSDRQWTDGDELAFCMRVAKHAVRRIEEPNLWKEEYLHRMQKLTLLDDLPWQPHEVRHQAMHISADECTAPPIESLRRLPPQVKRTIESRMAARSQARSIVRDQRVPSWSELRCLSAKEDSQLKALAESLQDPMKLNKIAQAVLDAASQAYARMMTGVHIPMIPTRSFFRGQNKRAKVYVEQIPSNSLRAALVQESRAKDMRMLARGSKTFAMLQSKQTEPSSSANKTVPSRAEVIVLDENDTSARRTAPSRAEVIVLDDDDTEDELPRKPLQDKTNQDEGVVQSGATEAREQVSEKSTPQEPPTAVAAIPSSSTLVPTASTPKQVQQTGTPSASPSVPSTPLNRPKCAISPRLCESFFHLYGEHINNGMSEDAKIATMLYRQGIPEGRSSIVLETLLFAIGGRFGLGMSHSWGVPGGRPASPVVSKPRSLPRKCIHPFHARGIVFIDKDRVHELEPSFWEKVSYPSQDGQLTREQVGNSLCAGAALHPRATRSPIILLDWSDIPYAVWLMQTCEAECGRWKEIENDAEWLQHEQEMAKKEQERGPGCICCRHFDPLIERSLRPKL